MDGTRICAEEGCEKPLKVRGMCRPHYLIWRRVTPPELRPPITDEERWHARVQRKGPDDCWEWSGPLSWQGYGRFTLTGGKRFIASRYALIRAVGEPPTPHHQACHTCDNPPCCNPAHLYWGTQKDNSRDAAVRDRMPKGERHRKAKVTEEQVLEIRRLAADGWMKSELADKYGLSRTAMRQLVIGETWRHLPLTENRGTANGIRNRDRRGRFQ